MTQLSESLFHQLAAEDPVQLLDLCRRGEMTPGLLTFALEIAGNEIDGLEDEVVSVLVRHLNHEKAIVREGAVIGLVDHARHQVVEQLRRVAENDSSNAARTVAGNVLRLAAESQVSR